LLLFPEGTRTPDGKIHRPKWGFAMILEQAPEVPLVMIRLEGTYEAMSRHQSWPRPRKVTVHYGKPFVIAPRRENDERREYFEKCIDRVMEEWRALGGETAEE
jgi:1-acyl-sn-glycerol-3-phosphate acyltransferase